MNKTFTQHGKEIVINENQQGHEHALTDHHNHGGGSNHSSLTIDNANVHVMKLQDGTYATHYFPYWGYSSLEDLAKDIIDKVPEFGPNLIKKGDKINE